MLTVDHQTIGEATAAFARDPRAAADVVAIADRALHAGPFSVTRKDAVPPSGDKHDYMSLGTYWWPDPGRPQGAPYIRRDGEVNPEINRYDRPQVSGMADAVSTLAAAAMLTGRVTYAARAVQLLETWFLDPATRMNPHLRFGQAIPGRCEGRCIGIIDTECFVRVCDAIALLRPSGALPERIDTGLATWLGAYLDWLLDSPLGIAEAEERNNHGTCHDVQAVALALHLGRLEVARAILARVPERRIRVQVEPDGRQPLELERTKSWSYSLKNLMALLNLAGWGRRLDVDIWGYRSADGRTVAAALDWMLPFALGQQAWQHRQLGRFDGEALFPALVRAAQLDGTGRYSALIGRSGIDRAGICLAILAACPLGGAGAIDVRGAHRNSSSE